MHGHDITERIEVFEREDGERGVRSKRPIHTNEFICEYEGNLLTESEAKQLEKKYMEEDDPIYMLQVRKKNTTEYQNTCINNGICSTCKIKLLLQAQYQQKVVVFDAFPRVDSVGRYINHSTKPNINLMKPIEVRGRLRIGFVAKRHIEKGEELFWNYGFDRRNGELPPWYRDPPQPQHHQPSAPTPTPHGVQDQRSVASTPTPHGSSNPQHQQSVPPHPSLLLSPPSEQQQQQSELSTIPDGSDHIPSSTETTPSRPRGRREVTCMVPGCGQRVKKIWNHLYQTKAHNNLTGEIYVILFLTLFC